MEENKENIESEEIDLYYFAKDIINIKTVQKKPTPYSREQLRTFLKNPISNHSQLKQFSSWLKYASGHYQRFLRMFSQLYTFDWLVYPNFPDNKFNKKDIIKKSYDESISYINKLNMKFYAPIIIEKTLELGNFYLYVLEDTDSIILKEINYGMCKITSFENDCYKFSIDLSMLRDDFIGQMPLEIQYVYKLYKEGKYVNPNDIGTDKNKWYEPKMGFAFSSDNFTENTPPPLCSVFDDIMALDESKDRYEDKSISDNLKLIHQKIPLNKEKDYKPVTNKDITEQYHNATKRTVPQSVGVTTNPFDIEMLSFDKVQQSAINEVADTEMNIFSSIGISNLLFNNEKSSSNALKYSVGTDEGYVYPYVVQIENFINCLLKENKKSAYPFKLWILPITIFNQQDKVKLYKEALAFGGSRLLYLSSMGLNPYCGTKILKLEQEILDIDNIMIVKQDSHTIGADTSNVGRPDNESVGKNISESTEKDRERQ